MEKIQINLKDIQIKDLNERVYPIVDLHIEMGNHIFREAKTIEVNDLARLLHKGEDVEVTEQEVREIIFVLSQEPLYFKPWVHNQIIQYFTEKLPKQDGAE